MLFLIKFVKFYLLYWAHLDGFEHHSGEKRYIFLHQCENIDELIELILRYFNPLTSGFSCRFVFVCMTFLWRPDAKGLKKDKFVSTPSNNNCYDKTHVILEDGASILSKWNHKEPNTGLIFGTLHAKSDTKLSKDTMSPLFWYMQTVSLTFYYNSYADNSLIFEQLDSSLSNIFINK